MSEVKKYYWLKLKRDFFKRHDVEIIESMPNGKDYVLFYLKLLVESIDHEGSLRFSETLPYNAEMLSTITRTNIDIVRSAVKVFSELGMMEVMDDGTFYMNQIQGMIGDETEWAEKKRLYREEQKRQIETREGQEKTLSDKSIEKELDREKDKELEKDSEKKPEKPPKTAYGKSGLVLLTDKEYNSFVDDYGKDVANKLIDKLDAYKLSKGASYKSDAGAIRSWVIDEISARPLTPQQKESLFSQTAVPDKPKKHPVWFDHAFKCEKCGIMILELEQSCRGCGTPCNEFSPEYLAEQKRLDGHV